MAERRVAHPTTDDKVKLLDLPPPDKNLAEYRKGLAIDPDIINDEVCEHPEKFEHVADNYALAVAEHDAAKYLLEVAEAREGKKQRELALQEDRKLTEGSLRELVLMATPVQEAQRRLLNAKACVGEWAALKESWQQRSYMLKECVSIHLTRMTSSSSVTAPRDALAAGMHERLGELRQERGYKPRRTRG